MSVRPCRRVASPDLWAKYLGQLKEVVPKLSRVGVLGQVSSQVGFAELEAASRNQSVALEVADLRRPEDFNGAPVSKPGRKLRAQELATKAIEKIIDPAASPEKRVQRRRRLTKGPD